MNRYVKLLTNAIDELIAADNHVYSLEEALRVLAIAAGSEPAIIDMLEKDAYSDHECHCPHCEDEKEYDGDEEEDEDYDDFDDEDYDEDEDSEIVKEWTATTDKQGRVFIGKKILDALADLQSSQRPGLTVGRCYDGEYAEIALGQDSIEEGDYDDITYYKSTKDLHIGLKTLFGSNTEVQITLYNNGDCLITLP